MAELLLANQADPNAVGSTGQTPLHLAAEKDYTNIAALLLASKANVNAKNSLGYTPLHAAVLSGSKGVAELLLAHNADPNVKARNGWTAMEGAVWQEQANMVDLLLRHGVRNYSGEIFVAARDGDLEKMQALLNGNPDLALTKDKYDRRPLQEAAMNGRKDVAALLLASKAGVDDPDENGFTPLHWAGWNGDKEMAELLLANKAGVNARDHFGRTALHWAAIFGHTDVAALLLASKADGNARDDAGSTPLELAARNGHKEVELLWGTSLPGTVGLPGTGADGPDLGARNRKNEGTAARTSVTEACLEQEKPTAVIETRYLPKPDGSNDYKICLAYLSYMMDAEPITNMLNMPAYSSGILPDEFDEPIPGYVALPLGTSLVLTEAGARPRGRAQLISIEKLKPTASEPRAISTNPPIIAVTAPTEGVTSHPMINLRGTSDHPLRRVRFDVLNKAHSSTNQQGYVTGSFFDTARWQDTTNYWECFDLKLGLGTNTIVLHCQDLAGRETTTNLVYIFRLPDDEVPPRVSLDWPAPGCQVSGSSFTVHGQVDDESTYIVGQIFSEGRTTTADGLVEREGRFWLENVPLAAKTNLLTLTATDATGRVSVTKLPIIRSETTLVIKSVPPSQLWQLQTKVTGSVSPPEQEVWVNGQQATVQPDGTWVAMGVPLTTGGVAIFQAVATLKSGQPMASPPGTPVLNSAFNAREADAIEADLPAESVVLNMERPVYGAFKLHVTGASGKSFILAASTNLIDWTPILTNLNSGATFDYEDTNVTSYGCRFFRTTPLR